MMTPARAAPRRSPFFQRLSSQTLAPWALAALTGAGCIPKKEPAPASTLTEDPARATPAPGPSPAGSRYDHSAALASSSLAKAFSADFEIGAALETTQIGVVGDIVAHHFNRVTAENAMKLGQMCPRPECNYGAADTLADFARSHRQAMTGHAFVWHQMYPAWFFKDGGRPASAALVSERLRTHIFKVTERYADVVDNWDVVNEAISDSRTMTYRDQSEGSPWFEAFGGPGYIRAAFEHARAAAEAHDPTVKLYYNDYNVAFPEKRKKIIAMIRELRAAGVRVDGVGMQGHWNIESPTAQEIDTAIKELAAEGLEVKISELDVNVYARDDHGTKVWQAAMADSPELQRKLAARYAEIFRVFKENAKIIKHITFWGVTDEKSWLNYWPIRRDNYPLLFDREHQPKPAFQAVLDAAAPAPP